MRNTGEERQGGDALSRFVTRLDELTATPRGEKFLLDQVTQAMRELVARDDWLDVQCTHPDATYYRQYLLHADPSGRFSVVSFVWGPGQRTPVHDHGAWGVIGMLRGSEVAQRYRLQDGRLVKDGQLERLEPGDVTIVSPTEGDIHVVSNAFDDRVSISIHAYGVDIGKQKRRVYDLQSGAAKEFVSGYSIPVAKS